MAENIRTYSKLKKEKTTEELSHFSKEITEKYATSEIEYSQSDLARDNNITTKCCRRLMDDAIVYARVSIQTAILVKNKAKQKSKMKVKEAGGRSISHHEDLMRKRAEYLLTAFTKCEIRQIAEDIANNHSNPISYFTRKHSIESDYITKLILKKAIVEDIVSDEIMELIIQRSLKNNDNPKVRQIFEKFREERKVYRSSQ